MYVGLFASKLLFAVYVDFFFFIFYLKELHNCYLFSAAHASISVCA
jgi:hypothetical protein